MATKKITDLTATTTLVNADLLPVVTNVATTPVSKKITWANVLSTINTWLASLGLYLPGSNKVGIGVTPLAMLHLHSTTYDLTLGGSGPNYASNLYYSGGWKYVANGPGMVFGLNNANGDFAIFQAASGLAGAAATLAAKLIVTNFGNTALGATNPPSGGGTPVLALAQATGNPTGIGANTAGLIAKDSGGTCELYAWDEAGNVTLLSPHASDAPAWMYDEIPGMEIVHKSENIYTGRIEWTNESRRNVLMQAMVNGEVLPDGDKRIFHLIETYAEYNARAGQDLQTQDWDANQEYWRVRTEADPPDGPGVCPSVYTKKDKPKWCVI